jgi:hypothetical protein
MAGASVLPETHTVAVHGGFFISFDTTIHLAKELANAR